MFDNNSVHSNFRLSPLVYYRLLHSSRKRAATLKRFPLTSQSPPTIIRRIRHPRKTQKRVRWSTRIPNNNPPLPARRAVNGKAAPVPVNPAARHQNHPLLLRNPPLAQRAVTRKPSTTLRALTRAFPVRRNHLRAVKVSQVRRVVM